MNFGVMLGLTRRAPSTDMSLVKACLLIALGSIFNHSLPHGLFMQISEIAP